MFRKSKKSAARVCNLKSLICGVMVFLVAACASGPAPEKKSKRVTILSDSNSQHREDPQNDARARDREAAEQIQAEIGLIHDPELLAYIRLLGRRVARQVQGSSQDFDFFILDMKEPNAFALPGGSIYLSRGLLAMTNSEDELVNVLGHEVAHVAAYHAEARMQKAQEVGLLSMLGIFAAAALGGGEAAGMAAQVAEAATAGAIAFYGREQEREADRLGQTYAVRAGWEARGLSDFLRTLENHERLHQGASFRASFLDTHPSTPERVASAISRADISAPLTRNPLAKSQEEYFQLLEGIVLGDNPQEGFFHDGRFIHADLDLSIRFPETWSVQNSRQAVTGFSPRAKTGVQLGIHGEGEDPAKAASEYAERFGLQYLEASSLTIGSIPAFQAVALQSGPEGSLVLDLTWIAYQGNIYRIEGVASSASYRSQRGLIRSVARSFRPLTEEERSRFRWQKLALVMAREGETLQDLVPRVETSWSLHEVAVMNGMSIETTLEKGQWIKVAREFPYILEAP